VKSLEYDMSKTHDVTSQDTCVHLTWLLLIGYH